MNKMEFKRKAYNQVKKVIENKRIALLIGMRRTGKTTILKQILSETSDGKMYTFDSFDFLRLTDLQLFNILRNDIQHGIKTILIDEIQKRENWDLILKNLYDEFIANGFDLKIVATGSSSISLINKDTGVTRMEKVMITSLDFSEYLHLSGKNNDYDTFENFLGFGGFPEFVNEDLPMSRQRELQFDPILNDDIPSQYNISILNLARLLNELSILTNGEFNKDKSSKNTQIPIQQINNYLSILEKAQIIKIVYKIDENKNLGRYPKFKIYINPHIHLWLLNKSFKELENKQKGHIIEAYWLFSESQTNSYYKKYYYLKNSITNQEVDFVVPSNDQNTPFETLIEFKYVDDVTTQDLNALLQINSTQKIIICKTNRKELGLSFLSVKDI